MPINESFHSDFQALTLDVIAKVAFAIDSDSQTNRKDAFYIAARAFFREVDLKRSWYMFLASQ